MSTSDSAFSTSATGGSPDNRPSVAVIPAAGFGTRLRPLTDALPKEMLPVGRRLALERIVDELHEVASIRRIVFVLSSVKEPLIRGRFGDSIDGLEIAYAIQPEMRGLGDAVLRAEPFVEAGKPFVVALGDAVFEEPKTGGITSRLADSFASSPENAVGLIVQKVPRERISRYGVVQPTDPGTAGQGSDFFAISDIVEKPSPEEAPSEYAAAARYVLTPDIFDILRATPPGKGGEIQMTDGMRSLLAAGRPGVAVPLRSGEVRHDIGSLDTYFKAFAAFALNDPEQGEAFSDYLKTRLEAQNGKERKV